MDKRGLRNLGLTPKKTIYIKKQEKEEKLTIK